jgi:myo-inositol-1(or 4)-monophosphatase
MHPMLNIAVKAARRAGSVINRASFDLDKLTVVKKQQNDFVTEVDQAAEQAIIRTISEAYPDHAFLAEESGKTGESDHVWIIDPLDGTTNFLHGMPQYCVSIALQTKGVLSHAVVFDPTRNELFTATKGAGAFLNERRIRVSKRIKMEESLIGTGFPFRQNDNIDEYLKAFKAVALNSAGIRRPGSAALDLAYVACGRYDGFWEMGISPWDMAAGALLVREAGGLVTDFSGGDAYLDEGKIVAGTPKLFRQLLITVSPTAKSPI